MLGVWHFLGVMFINVKMFLKFLLRSTGIYPEYIAECAPWSQKNYIHNCVSIYKLEIRKIEICFRNETQGELINYITQTRRLLLLQCNTAIPM